MLLLGIHSGWQDAGAALFDDYRPLAAVTLARCTGVAHDGGRLPAEAIEECLAIANVSRGDIAGLALSHGIFPQRYFTGLSLRRRFSRGLRALIGRETPTSLAEESRRSGRLDAEAMLDTAALLGDLGFNRNIPVRFYARHMALGLLPLFHTEWSEALLFTADVDGEGIAEGAQLLKYGRLASIFGGRSDVWPAPAGDGDGVPGRLVALAVDGLGLPDAQALFALAAYGEPILAQALLSHVHVDEEGRVVADFAAEGGAARWLRGLAEGHPPPFVAASLQKMLEDVYAEAIGRLMQRHGMTRLALGGGLFANPRLLLHLAARLVPAGLAVHPVPDDSSLPVGGVLDFLLQRDGLENWLQHRAPLAAAIPSGRDYGIDIDPVLGNAGCRLVSQDPLAAASALLNAGRSVALYGRQALGLQGGAGRMILFAGTRAGATGMANQRLDRPEMMPPRLVMHRDAAAELLALPSAASLPPGLAVPLAPAWRARLPAAMAPDFLCLPHQIEPGAEPLADALLDAYAALSGLPALLGLPMQIGNAAPLDAPADILRLLREDRVDYIATENAVWERGG